MARSNRQDVENNKIDPDERLDLTIPRNGSRTIRVKIQDEDEDGNVTPVNLTGQTIVAKAKTSYQAKEIAIEATIGNRADTDGEFDITWDASEAKELGDVLDLVHDCKRTPVSGQPIRVFAGLLELSKGVS